ncbi:10513_t:CDS:1, partial [Racocetra fulgida]
MSPQIIKVLLIRVNTWCDTINIKWSVFEKVNQLVFDEANTLKKLECWNRGTKGKMNNSLKSSE